MSSSNTTSIGQQTEQYWNNGGWEHEHPNGSVAELHQHHEKWLSFHRHHNWPGVDVSNCLNCHYSPYSRGSKPNEGSAEHGPSDLPWWLSKGLEP